MHCRQARRKLDLYLDGRLPPKQRWALEAHLSQCPGCRQALLDLHQVSRALEGLGSPSVPSSLVPRLTIQVLRHRCGGLNPRRGWRDGARWAIGLLGVLVSLAVGAPQALSGLEVTLSSSALTLSQEPDLSFVSVSSLLETSLDGLATMVDHLLLGIPGLETGLLVGSCLLLLSTGALLFWALILAPGNPLAFDGGV